MPRAILVLGEQFDLSPADAEAAVKQHINLCYDVCHFAIGYEEHECVIDELAAKGIQVGKIQISAALKAHLPVDLAMRDEVTDALARFNEPTYLHQVIAKTANGELIRYPDLPEALADSRNPVVNEWRAHFHVPVFVEDMGSGAINTKRYCQGAQQIQEHCFYTTRGSGNIHLECITG
ncbi:hypothetical protein ACFJIV_11230 [Mucilaginibacter sp. UC70_90]